MEFGVLKKIHPYMNNGEKLQLFMRDCQFRHKVNEKVNEKVIFFQSRVSFLAPFLFSKFISPPLGIMPLSANN